MFAFPANGELRIAFVPFKVHISFHEGQRLTVKVVEGENAGFMDTVGYQAIRVREDIVVLSWQEHIGSTIVHVLDFANDRTHIRNVGEGRLFAAVRNAACPFRRDGLRANERDVRLWPLADISKPSVNVCFRGAKRSQF